MENEKLVIAENNHNVVENNHNVVEKKQPQQIIQQETIVTKTNPQPSSQKSFQQQKISNNKTISGNLL